MRPTYRVKAWKSDKWWLAQVVAVSFGADPAVLKQLTQARSLAMVEVMARDLIAIFLDTDEDSFEVYIDCDLPGAVGDLVRVAGYARRELEEAQLLCQERSAEAARALTENGYSVREAAKVLGLSYQRVDQLVHGEAQSGLVKEQW